MIGNIPMARFFTPVDNSKLFLHTFCRCQQAMLLQFILWFTYHPAERGNTPGEPTDVEVAEKQQKCCEKLLRSQTGSWWPFLPHRDVLGWISDSGRNLILRTLRILRSPQLSLILFSVNKLYFLSRFSFTANLSRRQTAPICSLSPNMHIIELFCSVN